MRTLPLSWTDNSYWDLTLSIKKNWEAIDDEAKYCAQTVANSCRMFRDDAYFFPREGVPYFESVLGKKPPESLVIAYLRESSLIVPLVKEINIIEYQMTNRVITGQIRITTENGSIEDVHI